MSNAKLEDVTNVSGHSFFTISKPVIDIGRSLENDIVVFKNTVSSRHATIEQKPDGYFIVDWNSSNKTQLNGVELDPNSPQKLNDGDEIKIDTFPPLFSNWGRSNRLCRLHRPLMTMGPFFSTAVRR